MYEQFFHLNKRPFSIAPDPSFLYMSERHRDALAHLKYGLESDGGFVLVTGEVGTGKTTLLRNLIGQVPGDIDVAFILNPRLTVRELLQTICDELAIDYPTDDQHSVKPYIDRLNKHLLRTHRLGRSTVVVIDEAQNLSPAVLEQLRLLTNLETNERKLMRIILVGQPELKVMLARQELRQLSQRITARYHLEPLQLDDTRAYIAHRLSLAGGNPNLFSASASWNVHRHAGGVPRLINIIADRALLGAYAEGKPRIDFVHVQKAASETAPRQFNIWGWLGVTGAVLLGIGLLWTLLDATNKPSPAQAQSAQTQDVQTQDVQTQGALGAQTTAPPPVTIAEPRPPIVQPAPAATPEPVATTTQDLAPTPIPTIATVTPEPSAVLGGVPIAISGVPSYRSQRLAFSAMYNLWGIDYDPNNPLVPCDFAPRFQLQCTKRAYSWSDVARLNVPVVMQLAGADAQIFYVTAVSASNNQVSIIQGSTTSVVDLATLSQVWEGTIIALWPTPINYRGSIKDGSTGTAVQELRKLLGQATNRDLGNSRTFDTALSKVLREFQAASGVPADGIAGPATWLLLHRAAGYDIPELLG